MNRVSAGAALMMSMAALVVAIARSGGQESPAIPVGLEGRLKKLEVAMAEQTQRLDETQAQLSVVRLTRDPFQTKSTAWPVVARKLSAELRLSPSQMDVLDAALEHCEKAMKNAGGSIQNDRAIQLGGDTFHEESHYFEGDIDEVAIHSSVLTPKHVRRLYDIGANP